MTIDFKVSHYPRGVILFAVFFYVRYAVSYRDMDEIMAERGVRVDHATLNRWVVKYSPDIAKTAQQKKQSTAESWRMDETYIKVKGKWTYLDRAIDKHGKTFVSMRRDKAAARLFFRSAIKRITRPALCFKAFYSASATLVGIEVAHMIRKQQFLSNHTSPFKQFASLIA
jgi:putative transposase